MATAIPTNYWRVIAWDKKGERIASPVITDATKMKRLANNRWGTQTVRRIQVLEVKDGKSIILMDKRKG